MLEVMDGKRVTVFNESVSVQIKAGNTVALLCSTLNIPIWESKSGYVLGRTTTTVQTVGI